MNSKWTMMVGALALVGAVTVGKMASSGALAQEAKHGPAVVKIDLKNVKHQGEQNEQEGEDEMLTAPVTIGRAVDAAVARTPGYANSAELENENGTIVWSVDVVSQDGKKFEVKVNGTSGAVISSQVDQHDGDNEDGDGDGETNDDGGQHEGPGGDGDGETNDDGGK